MPLNPIYTKLQSTTKMLHQQKHFHPQDHPAPFQPYISIPTPRKKGNFHTPKIPFLPERKRARKNSRYDFLIFIIEARWNGIGKASFRADPVPEKRTGYGNDSSTSEQMFVGGGPGYYILGPHTIYNQKRLGCCFSRSYFFILCFFPPSLLRFVIELGSKM